MDEAIRLITEPITRAELKKIAAESYGDMAKAVVDLERKVMAVGGEMHADEEIFLLERGSRQENVWGVNLYPENNADQLIEFDSMINLRPRQGNRSRSVESAALQEQIKKVVHSLVSDV